MSWQDTVETICNDVEFLNILQTVSGIRKCYIVVGIVGMVALSACTVFSMSMLCTTLGCMYPLYASCVALNTNNTNNNNNNNNNNTDVHKWLIVWVVLVLLLTIETMIVAPFLFWFPFYSPIKLSIMVYMYYPTTGGAKYVYEKFVSPYVDPLVNIVARLVDIQFPLDIATLDTDTDNKKECESSDDRNKKTA